MPKGKGHRGQPKGWKTLAILEDWCFEEICTVCTGPAEYVVEFCDKQMLLCDLCGVKGVHIGCHKTAMGDITEEDLMSPRFQWFCSEECQTISNNIRDLSNRRFNLLDSTEYTYEFVRYSADSTYRPCQGIVNAAIGIFHSAFGPTRYKDNTDLVELVCQGKESEDIDDDAIEPYDEEEVKPDCRGFFVLVLRKGSSILSAAAIRVQGGLFAEIPYVATKDGYRREGNCRRLMAAVESLLQDLSIKWMAMPAVDEVAEFWIKKFNFRKAAKDVYTAMETRVLLPGGTKLLVKTVEGPPASLPTAPSTNTTITLTAKGKKVNDKKKKVRFDLKQQTDEEEGSEADEEDGSDDDDDDDDEESDEEEEEVDEYKGGSQQEEDAETESLCDEEEDGVDIQSKNKKPPAAPPIFNPTTATNPTTTTTENNSNCCSNCQTLEASSWVKDTTTNTVECILCNRYKRTHDGQPRPAKLYKKASSWRPKGWKPRTITTIAASAPNTTAGGGQVARQAPPTRAPRPILKRTQQPTSAAAAGARTGGAGQGRARIARRHRKPCLASQARQRILLLERLCEQKRVQTSAVVTEARLGLREDIEECVVSSGVADTILTLARKFEGVPRPVPITDMTGLPLKLSSSSASVSREAVEAAVKKVKEERDQLAQRLSTLEKELLQAETDKATAHSQLTSHQLDHTATLETLASLQSQIQAKDVWIANTHAAMTKQQETAAAVAQGVAAMQQEKQRILAQAAANQQLLVQAGQEIPALKQQLEGAQKTVVALQGQLEEENKVVVAAKEAVAVEQKAKTVLETQLAAAHTNYSLLDKQHNKIWEDFKVKEEEVVDVKKQLEAEKEDKQRLLAVVAAKDEELVKVQKALVEANQQQEAVHAAVVAALRSQHAQEKEAATAELAALKAQLLQALDDNKALQDKVEHQQQKEPIPLQKTNSTHADGPVVHGGNAKRSGGTPTTKSAEQLVEAAGEEEATKPHKQPSNDAPVHSTPTANANANQQNPDDNNDDDDDDEEDNTVRQDRGFFSLFASKFLGGGGGGGSNSKRKRKTGSQSAQGNTNNDGNNDDNQQQFEGEVGDNWNTNNTTTTDDGDDDDNSNHNTTPSAAAGHQAATPGRGGGSSDLIMPPISMNSALKPPAAPTENQTPPSVHLRKKVKSNLAGADDGDNVEKDENKTIAGLTTSMQKKQQQQQGSPGKKGKAVAVVGCGSSRRVTSGGGKKNKDDDGGVLETVTEEEQQEGDNAVGDKVEDAGKKTSVVVVAENTNTGGRKKTVAKQQPSTTLVSDRRLTRNKKQQQQQQEEEVKNASTTISDRDREVEKALATAMAVAEALGHDNDSD